MKITVILVKLVFLGALLIISNNNLYLSDKDDFKTFLDYYSAWIESTFNNAKTLTLYVIKSEWLPRDGTYVKKISSNEEDIFEIEFNRIYGT